MKARSAAVAILLTLSATAWQADAHARTVIVKRTVTTTTLTTTTGARCSCIVRRYAHRRHWHGSYSGYWAYGSLYWTFTPPWLTSLRAAPYE